MDSLELYELIEEGLLDGEPMEYIAEDVMDILGCEPEEAMWRVQHMAKVLERELI